MGMTQVFRRPLVAFRMLHSRLRFAVTSLGNNSETTQGGTVPAFHDLAHSLHSQTLQVDLLCDNSQARKTADLLTTVYSRSRATAMAPPTRPTTHLAKASLKNTHLTPYLDLIRRALPKERLNPADMYSPDITFAQRRKIDEISSKIWSLELELRALWPVRDRIAYIEARRGHRPIGLT